jgi:hypothetical protein
MPRQTTMKCLNNIKPGKYYVRGFVLLLGSALFVVKLSFAQCDINVIEDESMYVPHIVRLDTSTKYKMTSCMLSFKEQKLALEWTVERNIDMQDMYWIERSADGQVFEVIGFSEEGKDIAGLGKSFQFYDPSPLGGQAYYRVLCAEGESIKVLGPIMNVSSAWDEVLSSNSASILLHGGSSFGNRVDVFMGKLPMIRASYYFGDKRLGQLPERNTLHMASNNDKIHLPKSFIPLPQSSPHFQFPE